MSDDDDDDDDIAWCTNPYHVVSQCSLMPGCRLACGDQHRLTGNGSALEVVP